MINLYGGTTQAGFDKIIESCNEEANGEYRIVGNLTPSDADGQREQFVRRLAAHDDGMDLLGMDVTWTAEFAEAGWIRELKGEQKAAAEEDAIKPALETAMWKDKLYAIPKHTNVQLLWYRPSLTPEAPTTWDQITEEAQKLKDEGKPHVISVTGAQYEGYVVVFNTILASLGGTLVNEDSTEVTVDDKTVQALEILKDLATGGLASASLSNSQEPEVFEPHHIRMVSHASEMWIFRLVPSRVRVIWDVSLVKQDETHCVFRDHIRVEHKSRLLWWLSKIALVNWIVQRHDDEETPRFAKNLVEACARRLSS